MNRYNQRQTSNKSMLIAIVAVVLAFAIVIASVLTTGYLLTGTANVRKWGSQTQLPAPDISGETGDDGPGGDEANGDGNNVIITPGEEHGISLTSLLVAPDEYGEYGISPQAETAYEITATPNVSDVTDFTWTINWKNVSSAWANGKSIASYINFDVAEDNPLKAIVSIKEAFGEQAIISCTYNFNSNIKATSTVDYIKHITNLQVTGFHPEWVGDSEMEIALSATYGVGTVQGTLKACYAYCELTDSAVSYLQSSQYYSPWVASNNGNLMIVKSTASGNVGKTNLDEDVFEPHIMHFIKDSLNSGATGNRNYLYAMFNRLATETSNQIRCCVDYTYTFDSTVYEDSTAYSAYGALDPDLYPSSLLSVNNVNLSNGALYFY